MGWGRNNEQGQAAELRLHDNRVACGGDWTLAHIGRLSARANRMAWPSGPAVTFDMAGLRRLDTAGAWLLHRILQHLRGQGRAVSFQNFSDEARGLLELVARTAPPPGAVVKVPAPGLLEYAGRRTLISAGHGVRFLAFVGEAALSIGGQLARPARIRGRAVLEELGEAGYKALPIVGLLSFLLGLVIAYQGGVQLRIYGASIYVVDLVGLAMLRELSPLITAIIVAGRTGSAYAAQIGTMQVTEEVDALRAMGIPPMDLLVAPKVLALFIALPLLTVYSDIMAMLGGMAMAAAQLGIGFNTFLERLVVAVSVESFLIGVGKAPVFAVIIAILGCYHGFRVTGSAQSVGRHTTISVVQAILAVIVVDAVFSVVFSYLGI